VGDVSELTAIDHVAVAVHDLEAAIAYYRDTFGAEVTHREVVERDGVEEALLAVADSYIQLLTPVRDDSPVAKSLATRGEGLHHVCIEVEDIESAMESLRKAGAPLIDREPRPGAGGARVAFVHPKGMRGVLTELREGPAGADAPISGRRPS